MSRHIGIFDHLGWAVVVVADDAHAIVDRRRIALVEPGVPCMPIHHPPHGLSIDAVAELVARVRASAVRATAAAFDALSTTLQEPVASLHLRTMPSGFPTDIGTLLRAPWHARADAVMYREVLTAVAHARGWPVAYYDAKTIEAQAAALLGARADAVLRAPRLRLGPPWTSDHRKAFAAALCTPSTGPRSASADPQRNRAG